MVHKEEPIMAFEITKPGAAFSIVRNQAQSELARFNRSREVAKLNLEAAKHMAAERLYQIKGRYAMELQNELEYFEFTSTDALVQDIVKRLNEGGRSPEAQAYMDQLAGELLGLHKEYAGGIVKIGITNIAQEASKSV